ncbi:unnamed protein product [Ambrosiozyma monospora]|uniref:Unnamed protein product n=1 Tax=Ambrosiozyma monospora TaxID=43982 RepID=A0ACB5T989_AMBMO|nr:unnamed protein product [Ambrosiozyma monospora]
MSNFNLQLRQAASGIDPVVADYALGYFNHISSSTEDAVLAQQLDIPKEVAFLEELLISAGGDPVKVDKLSKKLSETFTKKLKDNMAKLSITGDTSKRLLDINLIHNHQRDLDSSLALLQSTTDLEHTGRIMETRVDKKKLQKAEAKIAKKVAKRNNKFVK